jgi:hypothetical protein
MKNSIYTLLLCMLPSLFIFSCRKHKTTAQICNLSSLTDSTTSLQSVTQFTYDNNNRVTSALVTGVYGCKRTYQYLGDMIIFTVSDTTPGIQIELDTIVLNNFGLIQTQVSHFPSSGNTIHETFQYDDAGVATGSIETENGLPGDTLLYTTVAGDLLNENLKGESTPKNIFTYYPSKNILYGDPTDFRQLLYYGAYYYKNKHMLSELYSPGKSFKSYKYTYVDNRISQQVLGWWKNGSPDTVTHIINYSYTCK